MESNVKTTRKRPGGQVTVNESALTGQLLEQMDELKELYQGNRRTAESLQRLVNDLLSASVEVNTAPLAE